MNTAWLQRAILRAASLLAPGDQRAQWLHEWRSELWYIPPRGATLFCLGGVRDALWLRRNNLSLEKRTRAHLESPLSGLAFLAALAAVGILSAVSVPAPQNLAPFWHLSARDLPVGCVVMLPLSCLVLAATRLAMGGARATCPSVPWTSRIRRGLFLALKICLVQPIMLGGFIVLVRIGTVPVAPLGLCASWILAFRWVLLDQRRRCPVCLRLLTHPVRIGTPSETFLEWYGAESTCSRGHGLLHTSVMPASYSGNPRWLSLDDSWSGLFQAAPRGRQE
jgi:hypothetical protein